MEHIFRIFDFNVSNEKTIEDSSEEEDQQGPSKPNKDTSKFIIQMFGVNETGETCSILAEEYKPFFYVMVNDKWNMASKNKFLEHIKTKIGKYYEDSITSCIIVKRKK